MKVSKEFMIGTVTVLKRKFRSLLYYILPLLKSYNLSYRRGFYTYNWWNDLPGETFWIARFIQHRFNPIQRVNFYSCFGSPMKFIQFYKGAKIFYTGENLQAGIFASMRNGYENHRVDKSDLALGFELLSHSKYYRFPLWILEHDFISPKATISDIKDFIERINKAEHRLRRSRKKEAVLVASHDVTGIRSKIIDVVNRVTPVTCAGKFRNNTNELKEEYSDNKAEYLKLFRFNICPENSLGEGYITEKVFQSIASGCIPIYWGAYLEPGILNPEAILCYEEGKEEELEMRIRELVEDDEAYRRFAEIPPFVEGAAERIWDIIQGLEEKLSKIIK